MFAFSDQEWPGFAKLMEESGELVEVLGPALLLSALGKLVQDGGKLMMVHGTTDHWSGDLRQMLMEEIADVEAAIDFVKDHNFTGKERKKIASRVKAKRNKFEKWDRGHEVRSRITKNRSKAKSRTTNAQRNVATQKRT
jgi:hypothetical protein